MGGEEGCKGSCGKYIKAVDTQNSAHLQLIKFSAVKSLGKDIVRRDMTHIIRNANIVQRFKSFFCQTFQQKINFLFVNRKMGYIQCGKHVGEGDPRWTNLNSCRGCGTNVGKWRGIWGWTTHMNGGQGPQVICYMGTPIDRLGETETTENITFLQTTYMRAVKMVFLWNCRINQALFQKKIYLCLDRH